MRKVILLCEDSQAEVSRASHHRSRHTLLEQEIERIKTRTYHDVAAHAKQFIDLMESADEALKNAIGLHNPVADKLKAHSERKYMHTETDTMEMNIASLKLSCDQLSLKVAEDEEAYAYLNVRIKEFLQEHENNLECITLVGNKLLVSDAQCLRSVYKRLPLQPSLPCIERMS